MASSGMGDFIISLAHFCEVCGPTSILCTQVAPSVCAVCCATPPNEEPSSSCYQYSDLLTPSKNLSSPFETPPMSPVSPRGTYNPYFPALQLDAGPTRRFSEVSLDADAEGCENCSFLLPKDIVERLPEGAPGSPKKAGGRNGSPVLRSSEHIMTRGRPRARDQDLDDYEEGCQTPSDAIDSDISKSFPSSTSSSSPPSISSSSPPSPLWTSRKPHSHTITYLTTRQPISPATFSLLRRSYVRTISCEMLPRGSASGPLYFGDPSSGYTIAYVFRLPDPCARGRLRTYALIALGGRDSWRVSMTMRRITEYFEGIANQIIAMAGKVLERESPLPSRPATAVRASDCHPRTPPLSTSSVSMPAGPLSSVYSSDRKGKEKASPLSPQSTGSMAGGLPGSGQASMSAASSPTVRNITPVSSFLSAKKVDPDGYPRVSREVMRSKGLAEIVGDQSFFVMLHAKFCVLLSGLVKEFGTVST